MTGKLGDQPATLQLTPVAAPKGDTQTPETKTAGALTIEATLADGRFDGELRPASGDARALLSGKLKVGTVTLPHGAQAKASKPDAKATSGPRQPRPRRTPRCLRPRPGPTGRCRSHR
jgi:hypothetical protein